MVIDNSGVKGFGAGEWLHEKRGGTPHWSWRKLHQAVDPNSDESLAGERFRQVSRQLAGGWGIGVEGPSDQGR